ncbi:MAG: type 2 lantipeptide synthetase LanM family protein [Chloroflexi bacterium]|nr:type 2 lantipeptide synthetase LanM family protein [Chloroflexota bacterium]MCI0576024.1 type 2 lantipeptide synthetase LanM family protein [Chloroflexota bacterium]MCI0645148.1 type 2 lantipeptide synthetase LanM family protein [Chloroflexota bacterium]MCI0725628.1 type 2 lantipeptide synthetase LanM family protein [Chloroflexota bacterium]
MTRELFQDPTWYQATMLTERLATLPAGPNLADLPTDEQLAAQRWQQWRAQSPFSDDQYFERRLAIDGLSQEQFRHLLGESPAAIQARFPAPPAWLVQLSEAYADFTDTPGALPENIARSLETTFLAAVAPLIHQTHHRLQSGLQLLDQPHQLFDPATIEGVLMADLPDRLLLMITRTLVLELHVARLRGLLAGETADERFQSFVHWLARPENNLTLWQEYPTLARQLVTYVNHWLTAKLEFLQRLYDNYSAIQATFSPGQKLGRLVHLESYLGDAHQGSRTVMAATFESGYRLVYKPRSLASSHHFQELLQWLNEQGNRHPFRLLPTLDYGHYGWTEFATAQGCSTVEEVRRFYWRLGAYLALLYALRATDFHYQNLIAAGEQPILVDLETFFQPPAAENRGYRPDSVAYQALMNSVVRIGLLPQRLWQWMDAEPMAVDFSGLGGAAGQVYNKPVPQWVNVGTDQMRISHGREVFQGAQNQPTLDGVPVAPLQYVDEVTTGFRETYELLVHHREALLAAGGPLARFAGDEMRVIMRPTMVYSMLIKDGRHPDLQRNALDRDRYFDRLWVGIDYQPKMEHVIAYERGDLRQDDVPIFMIRPNSRDLWTGSGDRVPNFFDDSGEALTRQRIGKMGPADLQQQLWFMRASLATLSMKADQEPAAVPYRFDDQPPATREELLVTAETLGDRLEALALWNNDQADWIGLSVNGDNWVLTPVGLDLYSGTPGIALFLAYLGALTGQEKYTRLAQAALNTARQEIDSASGWLKLVGGFSGWGGVIYALTHLGVLWQQPALLDEAEAIATTLPPLIAQDQFFDVMAGAAGCLAALLALYRSRPSPQTLATAVQCGQRLLDHARPMAQGLGWLGPHNQDKALTGFSHGAAGVAWALLQLAHLSGESRFKAAALEAMAYERHLFSPEAGNWPDLRPLPPGQYPFRTAWCHGAPGIGLARLSALPYLDDAAVRQEIGVAVETTLAGGFGRNHSLCHGDLGNLELLAQAQKKFDRPEWADQLAGLTGAILANIRQAGPRCGVPLGLETPGLMNGLAGIGYGLLRLAEPESVPSILLLEPPPSLRRA